MDGESAAAEEDFLLQGASARLLFDFEEGSQIEALGCTRVIAFSEKLDYAFLQIATGTTRAPLKLAPQRVTFNATSYMPLNIIQHPRGEMKQVAFRNNLLTDADNETIRYFTDTDFGSSGSPVCDDDWHVVALHRGAIFVQGVSFQGKASAYVNYGTQIQAILADIAPKPELSAKLVSH